MSKHYAHSNFPVFRTIIAQRIKLLRDNRNKFQKTLTAIWQDIENVLEHP